jgi:hypothetical protein
LSAAKDACSGFGAGDAGILNAAKTIANATRI